MINVKVKTVREHLIEISKDSNREGAEGLLNLGNQLLMSMPEDILAGVPSVLDAIERSKQDDLYLAFSALISNGIQHLMELAEKEANQC